MVPKHWLDVRANKIILAKLSIKDLYLKSESLYPLVELKKYVHYYKCKDEQYLFYENKSKKPKIKNQTYVNITFK